MLHCTELLFCCKTLPFTPNQCFSHLLQRCHNIWKLQGLLPALGIRSDLMLSMSSEEEKAARPTPRTALMHSSSKTIGSLRASLLLSRVLIPFTDWTTMDWTVMFTWKTASCQLWALGIIHFGFFFVIIFVTFPGSVPQPQHAVILWTTAVLQVLLKLNQRVWV